MSNDIHPHHYVAAIGRLLCSLTEVIELVDAYTLERICCPCLSSCFPARSRRPQPASPPLRAEAQDGELDNLLSERSEGWALDEDSDSGEVSGEQHVRGTERRPKSKEYKREPAMSSRTMDRQSDSSQADLGSGSARKDLWLPDATLEQLAQEEAEQAERERREEERNRIGIKEEDEFGDYAPATTAELQLSSTGVEIPRDQVDPGT